MDLFFKTKKPLNFEKIESKEGKDGQLIYKIKNIEYFGNHDIIG